ncbi:MAG TPA: hypothetical protein VFV33_05330 [Gemmatimonadaceae bacterium]|nr:hypothetical protein [Gemmatimonadaceae bacterium]
MRRNVQRIEKSVVQVVQVVQVVYVVHVALVARRRGSCARRERSADGAGRRDAA